MRALMRAVQLATSAVMLASAFTIIGVVQGAAPHTWLVVVWAGAGGILAVGLWLAAR